MFLVPFLDIINIPTFLASKELYVAAVFPNTLINSNSMDLLFEFGSANNSPKAYFLKFQVARD